MKILIAESDKAFCLHIPLMLLCNRACAALLAGSLRRKRRRSYGSLEISETGVITTAQAHALLKTLRKSKALLKQTGLPLLDIEEADGSRIVITL